MFIKLALQSLINRKGSVLLTILAMTVSIFVLLGVEHVRYQAKESFTNTVSGTDLIVGARTGSVNLLLYSVFRVGTPTNNITWDSFQRISSSRNVEWAIPISLGDSHKGYRVIGTNHDYFKYFSYGNKRSLTFLEGKPFEKMLDVVLGFDVATKLGYELGDKIVVAHGVSKTSFSLHDDRPFTVVGILEPTGTPVDQSLHVSLQGIEAIHIDWKQGVKIRGSTLTIEQIEKMTLEPKTITAFMVGLKSRIATFRVQRAINNYNKEPLMAILPGVALSELWQMMGILENTLRLVSALVLIAALLGLSAMLLASIRERQQEIRLLRVVGAPPFFLFLLIELEAILISLTSIFLGAIMLYFCLELVRDLLISHFGLHITSNIFSNSSPIFLIFVIFATLLAAAVPSFTAYKSGK